MGQQAEGAKKPKWKQNKACRLDSDAKSTPLRLRAVVLVPSFAAVADRRDPPLRFIVLLRARSLVFVLRSEREREEGGCG